jgi:hypothetical protein
MQHARPNAVRWMPHVSAALTALRGRRHQGLTTRDRILVRPIFQLWLR